MITRTCGNQIGNKHVKYNGMGVECAGAADWGLVSYDAAGNLGPWRALCNAAIPSPGQPAALLGFQAAEIVSPQRGPILQWGLVSPVVSALWPRTPPSGSEGPSSTKNAEVQGKGDTGQIVRRVPRKAPQEEHGERAGWTGQAGGGSASRGESPLSSRLPAPPVQPGQHACSRREPRGLHSPAWPGPPYFHPKGDHALQLRPPYRQGDPREWAAF